MHWITYMLHYVIARTVYDGARAAGISPMLMVVFAVLGLVVLHSGGIYGLRRWKVRREARWREEVRQDVRRKLSERGFR